MGSAPLPPVDAGHGEGTVAAGGEAGVLGERLLAVDGEVADLEDLVLVAGATEDPADDLHEDEGDQRRPEDDEDGRPELLPQLVRRPGVHQAVDTEGHAGAVRRQVGRLRGGDHLPRRGEVATAVLDHVRVAEDAQQHAAHEAGHAVGVDDTQRVVDLREGPHLGQVVPGHPDDGAADGADEDGAQAVDPAGARCDADQAADHAVDAAQEGGLLLPGEPGVHGDPDQDTGCGGQVRVHHGCRRAGAGVVRVSTVEPVPAQPQDAGADRRHHEVVGQGVLPISQESWSEDPGRHEAGHSGRHVDDVPTGEVERTLLGEVAAAPEQEGVHAVHAGRPQRHQQAPGAELDPADHASEEQQRRDRREHELEVGQRRRREVERDDGVGGRASLEPCSPNALVIAPGLPRKFSKKCCQVPVVPAFCVWVTTPFTRCTPPPMEVSPNPSLYSHRNHATSTSENPANIIARTLTAHFLGTRDA